MHKRKQVSQTDLIEQIVIRVTKSLVPVIKKTIFEQNKKLAKYTRKVVKEEIKNMAYDLMLEQRKGNFESDNIDISDQKPKSQNVNEANQRGRLKAKNILDDNFLSERDQAALNFEFDDDEAYENAEGTEALIETAGGKQYATHQQEVNPAEILSTNIRSTPPIDWKNIAEDELTREQKEMAADPSAIDYSSMMEMMDETLVDTNKKWGIETKGQSTQINPDVIKQEYEKEIKEA
jgi:hypothetical protein